MVLVVNEFLKCCTIIIRFWMLFMDSIRIDNFVLNRHSEPFIVAEIGVNHNGDLPTALAMIEAAKQAGVNAVKFQTFKAVEFIADPSQMYTYRSQGKEVTESMLQMFQRYEFKEDQWHTIKGKCQQEDIIFLSTPQNYSDLELLLKIGINAIKIGSDDFNNLPLIKKYATTGLPLILSSGMADLADVYYALEAAGFFSGYPVILLICTSQYPTPPEDVNLNKLKTLRAAFPTLITGFSDHTQGSLASSLAIACGAVFFEKHFTLDHNLPGPDHWFSADALGLKDWVTSVRQSWIMMGDSNICPTLQERQNKKSFCRVIVAAKDIDKGEVFSLGNLTLRRVAGGAGMMPAFFDSLLGKMAGREFKKNEPINL